MNLAYWALAVALGSALITPRANAQQHEAPGQSHAAGQDMKAGMERMSRDMSGAPMSGNTDRDFVAMMIPHHQGAIDMAEVELRHGKDPALRRLAKGIVTAQKNEIAMMKRWLATHPTH